MYACLLGFLRLIHTTLIRQPLHSLYFDGPESVGFWGGAANEDICFSLTATPSGFWQENPLQCSRLCEQKFEAFATFINFAVYTVVLLRFVNAIVFHMCFTRPVLCELRRVQSRITYAMQDDTG